MPSRLGTSVVLACALSLTSLQWALPAEADAPAAAQVVSAGDDLLPGGGSGPEALTALGDRTPEAAARNHMSTTKFTKLLRTDATATLDEDGRLYFVDPAPAQPKASAASSAPSSGPSSDPSSAQGATTAADVLTVPALHSRPGSTHPIYLDFDGVTIDPGNGWIGAGGFAAGTYTGFTLDSDPAFSATEIAYIQTVWKFISEKYSAYDVDVTTVDPGPAGYGRSSAADVNYGDHVVFTDDSTPVNQLCGGGCAGIAYVGVFSAAGAAAYSPAWVFTSKTFGIPAITGLAAAHEIGHTLGLTHDGDATHPDYYPGHANWVPIMGLSNQQAISQFSKGEYTGASNQQDDLAVIGANGDSGLAGSLTLPDDYGSGSSPTNLGDHISYALDGVIGSAADDDLFSIPRTCTSPLTATATGIGLGQSVDLKVDVLDASNNVLGSDDPGSDQAYVSADSTFEPTGVNASVTIPSTTPGNSYRIRVDGVGHNTAADGYTDYASIGQYHLTITGCPATNAPGAPATASATPHARTTTGTINWTAPASNGGAAITGYQVLGLPGGTVNLGNVLTYDASNLVPGTTYNVDVRAVNANGPGAAASTTLRVDTWAPTTKPVVTATASGSSVTVSWTTPANPGGAVLGGWQVTGTDPSKPIFDVVAASTSSKAYAGLALGSHSFTVTGLYSADDTSGVSASDPAVAVVTSAPGAPASASGTPHARSTTGTISWTAPTDDGGSPVTGYQVSGVPGGPFTVGNVLSYDASNLVPGTTYNVDVRAINANGSGPARSTTLRVGTWAPLTKPGLTASLSGSTATLTWTAPANPGGAVLTGWHVVGSGPGNSINDTLPASTLTQGYPGLAVGTQTFTVTGIYTADDTLGVIGSDPQSVTVTSTPGAPATVTGTPHARTTTGTITWTAPASNGGAAITGYTITGLPGGTVTLGNVLTYDASNLVPGTTYNLDVRAVNANGPGNAASTTLRVATWAPTTKPVLTVTKSGTTATLTWTEPTNPGGATLTSWHIARTGPGLLPADQDLTAPVIADTTTMTGLAAGTHQFTVTPVYTADDTTGVQTSDPGTAVITTAPNAPATASATPTARTSTGTVSWTAPASDGGSAITGYTISGLPGGTVTLGNVLTYHATNLVPGTTYNLDVRAVNTVGTSPATSTTLRVDTWAPTTKPGLTASLSGNTATMTWTAPANPGGAVLTGWHVVGGGPSDSIDETLPAGTLTKDYAGLAVGTHTFTVTGIYTADDTAGVLSSDPKSVTYTTAAGAPATVTGTPHARTTTATITWTAPASNGGAAITGYTITGLPGGTVTLGNVLTYDASNLVPGTTYNLDVRAVNANGPGNAASTTLRVATWAPTTKPVLTVTKSGTTATLSWTEPTNPGGATLTSWHIARTGPGLLPADQDLSAPVIADTTTTTGLAAGTHQFTVTPVYTADDTTGVQSSDPGTAVITTAPNAPATASASPTARTSTGTVSWTAPASDGGSAITGYTISGLPGGTVTLGNVLTYHATNLVPGTTYNVDVRAVNTVGTSPATSTTLRVETWAPTTRPGLTASLSGSTATLTWTAPANPGGAVLTGWHVVGTGPSDSIDENLPAGTLTKDYAGLAVGTHTFTVTGIYTADDTAGVTGSDAQSVTVTSTPGAPATATGTPHARSTTGTVSWTAPASDGGTAITGYVITGLPGGQVDLGNVLTYDAPNLVPGTTYNVDVRAINANGSGPARSTTLRVATWAPTTKPGLTASLTGSTATLSWTAPANPGGAVLTGWHVVGSGPGNSINDTLPASTLTQGYPGLAVGTQTFTVTGIYTADDTLGVIGSDPQSVTVTSPPGAPATATGTPHPRTTTGTVSWTAPASNGGTAITGYTITGLPGGTVTLGNVLTYEASNLVPGTTYNLGVRAINANGPGNVTSTTLRVATWAPTTKPVLTVTRSGTTATLTWTEPANPGNATLTSWHIARTGPGLLPADKDLTAPVPGNATQMAGLAVGTHTFVVTPTYAADDTAGVQSSAPVGTTVPKPLTPPSAPKIGTASSGSAGGAVNAVARWGAPTSTGGSAITSYKVVATRVTSSGAYLKTYVSSSRSATSRSYTWALPSGRYHFRVLAYNKLGASPYSAYSGYVRSQ